MIKVVPTGIIEILSGKSPEEFIKDAIRSDKIPEGWKYCEECNSCLVEVGVVYCQRCYESFYSPPKLMMEEIGRLQDLAKQLSVEKQISQDNYNIISKSNAEDKKELVKLREEVKAWRATASVMLVSFKTNKEHPAYKALESVRNDFDPRYKKV